MSGRLWAGRLPGKGGREGEKQSLQSSRPGWRPGTAPPPPQLAAPPVPGSSPAGSRPGHFLLRPASRCAPQVCSQLLSYRLCDLGQVAKLLCARRSPPQTMKGCRVLAQSSLKTPLAFLLTPPAPLPWFGRRTVGAHKWRPPLHCCRGGCAACHPSLGTPPSDVT